MKRRASRRGLRLLSYDHLVALRPGGSRPPLFLVCWEGGRLVGYRDLVRRLPNDLPVYGLRAPRFDPGSVLYPVPELEQLARVFLADVRRFRPDGPYLFAGYCFGGTLAHEMARQLEAQGQTADFLGLIESSPYGHGEGGPKRRPSRRIERERELFRSLEYQGPIDLARFAAGRLLGRGSFWRRRLRRTAYRVALRTGWALPGHLCRLDMVAIQRGMARYVAPSSNAQIVLIEARDPQREPEPSVWPRLAGGGVEVHYLVTKPGTGHLALMKEPYAARLAELMSACIEQALSRPTPVGLTAASARPRPSS